MDFRTGIKIGANLYKFIEKFNFDETFNFDNLICSRYPENISRLQSYARHNKIAFYADNGKKTLLNLFNQILSYNDNSYITNLSYQGKLYPALTSIVLSLEKSLNNAIEYPNKDYYTFAFEADEISRYFEWMKFDYLVLHNCFINQVDSCCLIEKRKKIQQAIMLNPKLNLIINADDPLFYGIDDIAGDASVNKKRKKIYYGMNNIEYCNDGDNISQKNDFFKCPRCSCDIRYEKSFYSHLGIYECDCGFKRPKPDIYADAKIYSDYTFLDVYFKGNKYVFKIPLGGLYNAYNALAVICTAFSLNIERKIITLGLENSISIPARDDVITYKNKKVKIKVIKNPTSLTEAIKELYKSKNIKPIFCLSDENIDGIDTSWIWDSNFEAFKDFENKIFTTSYRLDDIALRLKYAGVNQNLIMLEPSIKSAIECCYWELEDNEIMMIFTVPSLVSEIYEVLKK